MKSPKIPVALEGYPFILFAAFATLITALVECSWGATAGLALTGLVLWFFRDPERVVPVEENAAISPADGKIIVVEKIMDDRFLHREVLKISIFMNVFNVHVNRFPLTGTVKEIRLVPGRFYSADTEKGALHNEHCALLVTTKGGSEYAVVQVAGLIARRIVCWAEQGDTLESGQRYGLIRFGSRVDLYLPPQTEALVNKGQKVRAGETILARLP
ncbi:MAG: phosphatidylserine decarboxylase family protein [Desulfobulbaceae bacterium]